LGICRQVQGLGASVLIVEKSHVVSKNILRWPNLSFILPLTRASSGNPLAENPFMIIKNTNTTTAIAFPCIPTERRLSGAKKSPDLW
jgi:hypothetical protein